MKHPLPDWKKKIVRPDPLASLHRLPEFGKVLLLHSQSLQQPGKREIETQHWNVLRLTDR